MGWASYFEHIRDRQDDSTSDANAFVGTIGSSTPRHSVSPQSRNGPLSVQPSTTSAEQQTEAFTTIEFMFGLISHYYQIADDIARRFERDNWLKLSKEMDTLESQVHTVGRNTLFAGSEQVLARIGQLSQNLEDVLERARTVLAYLYNVSGDLFAELEAIASHRRDGVQVPETQRELEEKTVWILNGRKALEIEIEELSDRAIELQVVLAGYAQDSVIMNDKHSPPDKDAT